MENAVKLVKEISDTLESIGNGGNAPVSSLAVDYARFCHEANQRLEQCAAMISKGSDYQALQLAETEPVLLDLVSTLSFAGVKEWAEFCSANQLPIADKIDPKFVKALNALYSKGISANHPLYKDYRAAISSRDDAMALQIVKSIVRLNPSDSNAKEELLRLENKFFQLRVKELKAALDGRNEPAVVLVLEELERVSSRAKFEELHEYPQALAIRKKLRRIEASEQANQIASELPAALKTGDWRQLGDMLSRIAVMERDHEFTISADYEAARREAKSFFESKQKAAIEAARFHDALQMLGERAEMIDNRFTTKMGRTLEVLEEDYLVLSKLWRDAELFGKAIPEEMQTRVKRVASGLRSEIDRLKRGKRIALGVGSAAAAAVLALGGWLGWEMIQARDYTRQLGALLEAKQVQPTVKFLENVTAQHKRLTEKADLRAKMSEAETWIHEEQRKRAEADAVLAGLERVAAGSFADADLAQLTLRIKTASRIVADLADDLKGQPKEKLIQIQNKADAQFAQSRAVVQKGMSELLEKAEADVSAKLGFEHSVDELSKSIAEIEPQLKQIADLSNPALESSRPPEAMLSRAAALQKRVDTCKEQLAGIQKIREQLRAATTLEAYQKAIEEYQASLFVQSEEVKAARKLMVSFPKPDELLMTLLMPNDPVGWGGLKSEKGRFMPGDVLPVELSRLLALRDDDDLRNIWEATLTDYENGNSKRTIYCRGEIPNYTQNSVGDRVQYSWSGMFYDPKKTPDSVSFSNQTFSLLAFPGGGKRYQEMSAGRRTSASTALAGLYLNYMTDDAGTTYQKSILRIFDELAKMKESPVLVKAYIFHRLREFMKLRPNSWGVQYCPTLKADFATIDKLVEETPIRSGDWMTPRRNQDLGAKFNAFCSSLGARSYYAQTALNYSLIAETARSGMRYGGFLDDKGVPVLLGDATGQNELWVAGEDGAPTLMLKHGEGFESAKPVMPFSPVFFVLLDRKKLLNETAGKLKVRPDDLVIREGLPPFFKDLK